MNRIFHFAILISVTLPLSIVGQNFSIFPKGEKSPNVHHVGNVWLKELNPPDSIFNYSIAVATFDPDARLNWHTHPGGQILLFTEGAGFYQEKGKPKQVVRKGDVIKCFPNVEHWHGATPNSGVTYIATTPSQKGRTNWGEKVTDEEYYGMDKPILSDTNAAKLLIHLSKEKWKWMQDFKVDSLANLFHDDAAFVHMGATFNKEQELEVIKNKQIIYKSVEIQEASVRFVGSTGILLNKIRLVAIVGGNEVVNPFNVTEVYVQQNDTWNLVSLSFTRLLTPN